MNVVQQQNAFAARLEAAHGARNNVLRTDAAMPVVRHRVGTENNQRAGRKLAFDDVGARQSRDTEERRQLPVVAQRRADIRDALVDFPARLSTGNFWKRDGWSSLWVPMV